MTKSACTYCGVTASIRARILSGLETSLIPEYLIIIFKDNTRTLHCLTMDNKQLSDWIRVFSF